MAARKLKGAPPSRLTGRMPVSSPDSPWWSQVMLQITGPGGLVGRTLSIEELTSVVPCYPDGRRPRARAVARRLRPILELVSRGPNGSLGRGATYNVVPPPLPMSDGRANVGDDLIAADRDYIAAAVERMTGGKP